MMKRIRLYILLFATISFLAGCKKFLNEQPQTEIGESEFWKSEDDIKTGLAAMYDGVQAIFDNNYTLWGDARTDEVDVNQYGDDAYVVNALSAGTTGSDWSAFYRAIQRANLGLKYIPIIKEQYQTGLDQKVVNHYLAQCYTTRALCYFWIVRLWGAAPVWTEPYEDISKNPNKERTDPNVIINEVIIPDLEKAASFSNPATNIVYEANIGATLALRMDVAMWKKDYPGAVTWYNRLTALNKYSLETTANWKSIFTTPAATKEAIWHLQWDWTVDGGADVATLIGAGNTNSDFKAEDSVWNYFTTTPADIRGPLTIDFRVTTTRDKFPKFYPINLGTNGAQIYPNSAEANILFPIYRWADILLLRAEAANKLNDPTTALTLLNQIRTRAGVPTYTLVQLDNMAKRENAILEERKLELYMEAKRWFDLVRTDKVVEVMDPYIKRRQAQRNSPQNGFGDVRTILWPLNRAVLNANTSISQNPPY
jgi:starch-binding outer membrane protein, SusD/RagB family